MSTGAEHDAPGIMPFFVYGTLTYEDDGGKRWIDCVNRVERNVLVRGYTLWVTHGAFPYAMVDPDPDHYVFGDLLWPANDAAAGTLTERFDRIEGHPDFYRRTEVTVTVNTVRTEKAWMYTITPNGFVRPEDLKQIGSSWMTYRRSNPTPILIG